MFSGSMAIDYWECRTIYLKGKIQDVSLQTSSCVIEYYHKSRGFAEPCMKTE